MAIRNMEVDHFHPVNGADGFATKLDALDKALIAYDDTALDWIERLQEEFPADGDQPWKWYHFIQEADDGNSFSLTNFYRAAAYSDIGNLWLIDGDANGSIQDKVKLPANGGTISQSVLWHNPWFGGDFLSKFGTISDTNIFTDTRLDRTTLTITATVSFDAQCNPVDLPASKRMGLATLARQWFAMRYKSANTLGKQVGPVKGAIEAFCANALTALAAYETAGDAAGDADRQVAFDALLAQLPEQLKAALATAIKK